MGYEAADGEGGRPLGLKHAYADLCGALHAVFAITSALYQRRHTGHGQYIDVSMLRATVATMGAGLMEYELTGRVPRPRGNFDPVMSPYGNYPCRNEDEGNEDAWVSIAVRTETEWRGLVEAMGSPGLDRGADIRQPVRPAAKPAGAGRPAVGVDAGHDTVEAAELLQAHGRGGLSRARRRGTAV